MRPYMSRRGPNHVLTNVALFSAGSVTLVIVLYVVHASSSSTSGWRSTSMIQA